MNRIGLTTNTAIFCVAGLAIASAPAAADPEQSDGLEITVGIGVMSDPDYEGSDDYETMAIPAIELSWNDRVRFSTLQGLELSADVLATDELTVTLGFGYDEGRNEKDNKALKGLGDLEGGATFLGAVTYDLALPSAAQRLSFGLGFEKGLNGSRKGLEVEAGIDYAQQAFGGRGYWNIGANAVWADENHMSKTFGITSKQARASNVGLSRFNAKSGLKSVGVQIGAGYDLTESVALIGKIEVSQLQGDAADSPLVKDHGSSKQTSATLGLLYSW